MDFDPEFIELDAKITRALEFISAASALMPFVGDDRHTVARIGVEIAVEAELKRLFGWSNPSMTTPTPTPTPAPRHLRSKTTTAANRHEP